MPGDAIGTRFRPLTRQEIRGVSLDRGVELRVQAAKRLFRQDQELRANLTAADDGGDGHRNALGKCLARSGSGSRRAMAPDRSFRDRLDEDLDRAAAGQPNVPGHLVGDAIADQLRRPVRSTSCASSKTAVSTQPPLADPARSPAEKRPWSPRPGRGAEPST